MTESGMSGPSFDSLAPLSSPGLHRYAASEALSLIRSVIRLLDPVSFEWAAFFHPDIYFELAAGDFDGDQIDELATVSEGMVSLIFAPLSVVDQQGSLCMATIEPNMGTWTDIHAVGDFDGDGDDELAVATQDDVVMVIDGE